MLFSSVPFLFYFLPAVMIVYFAVPDKFKNAVLLVFSLVFYAWGEPKYVFLMLFSIFSGYIFGLLIDKYRGKKASGIFLVISVIISLGILCYFKYADFFISNINRMTFFFYPIFKNYNAYRYRFFSFPDNKL